MTKKRKRKFPPQPRDEQNPFGALLIGVAFVAATYVFVIDRND